MISGGNNMDKFKSNSEGKQFDNKSGGFKGFESRQMHKAVCSECKKECEVPFKPSGDRPVYCRDCFQKHKRF